MKRASLLLIAALVLVTLFVAPGCTTREKLQVATTTSLYDTGLWYQLEPMFEEMYGCDLEVLYAGTGKALEWGQRGDVDVLTVHDPEREQQFIAEGYGLERNCFAYNYFVIVGPDDDPAGIMGLSPEEAFARIMEEGLAGGARFVSRGDQSGTHGKEQAIWASAGYDYEEVRVSGAWYVEAGSGMGPTLVMAAEMDAYTLSDIGTFLAYKGELDLVSLVDQGDILRNIYSAIAINPEIHPNTNSDMARNLINFLLSPEIQEFIGEFGVEEYGQPLFYPCDGVCEQWGCPPCQECTVP